MDEFTARITGLRDRWVGLRQTEHDERKFDPLQPRVPGGDDAGQWTASGGMGTAEKLAKLGHDIFQDIESAGTVDQVIVGMRQHKAANPHVTTEELIQAADSAIAAKYPVEKYPNIDKFYTKMLAGREADIAKVANVKPARVLKPVTPKRAPSPSEFSKLTPKTAQAMQDGLPPPWSGDERRALRYYTGNSAVSNGLLRGWIQPPGKSASDQKKIEAAQRNIVHAKSAMRTSDRDMLVFRTAGPEQFGVATAKELHNLVGHAMVERGFMSTSTALGVGIGGKVKMEIEVPKGTPLAFVKSVSKYDYENEVLLAPGMKYTVVSVTGSAGRPTVRVRVEPTT